MSKSNFTKYPIGNPNTTNNGNSGNILSVSGDTITTQISSIICDSYPTLNNTANVIENELKSISNLKDLNDIAVRYKNKYIIKFIKNESVEKIKSYFMITKSSFSGLLIIDYLRAYRDEKDIEHFIKVLTEFTDRPISSDNYYIDHITLNELYELYDLTFDTKYFSDIINIIFKNLEPLSCEDILNIIAWLPYSNELEDFLLNYISENSFVSSQLAHKDINELLTAYSKLQMYLNLN